MAIYGESLTIQYVAWDTTNNAPKTGDAANHTLRWVKDGVAAAPTNAPSEVDAANAPGLYKLTLTATETQCWVGTLCGKSATSGVVIMPVTLTFERLPTAAPGSSGGLPVIGAAPLTNLDAAVSSRSTLTAADVWSYTTRELSAFAFQVTVGGYAAGQSPAEQLDTQGYTTARAAKLDNLNAAIGDVPMAVWSYTTRELSAFSFQVVVGGYATNQSPGEQIVALGYTSARASALDNLDTTVSSRLAATAYTAPDNAGIAAIKSQTDKLSFAGTGPYDVKATLDGEQVTVASNLDKTGYSLTTDYDRAKTALAVSEYTAPDNAGIAAIKAQTDKLTFDANNYVYATATVDVDEQAIADAVAAQIGSTQVIVTPIAASLIQQATNGGHIECWTHARVAASWTVANADLSGHDLRMIIYKPSDPSTKVAEFSGLTGLTVTYDASANQSTILLSADPLPGGSYAWVMRDQTADAVILKGTLVVYTAPDAS